MMSRALDALYRGAAVLAACCIAAICLLISAQVLLNAGTRAGLPLPPTIPSYADFAGYLLAAATFLALPWTLRTGGHVRVNLVTSRLPERAAWAVELVVLAAGTGFAGYATTYAAILAEESRRFGDVSSGIVAIPTWIVQLPMVAGLALLTAALGQSLFETWAARRPVLGGGEEA
ncbi:TRAP-type C4-dicarboxylate transport system permease small subunit [Hasllibacter halocynthiae]|uniref:TRAP transporter small permease protein n=1 Tax=Hasllibacter halocynthiae TaxID=595589 RepID=A0A2T0X7V4_9RHOB|nr:TRAP transporter small permease subunit [Hasllibacter halocynthiae]PRY95007.1 TRAP-type C4-dicarboxylate transport system permease small subunit [Hasllibacter halocynthiae]